MMRRQAVEERQRGRKGLHVQHNQWLMIGGAIGVSVLGGVLAYAHANAVLIFVVTAVALSLLAALVGVATEQIGSYLGSGATGVLQSGLGNLPELFVSFFALRAGLVGVVQSALVGSILGNSLFVLGLAFFVGGLRNGKQKFSQDPAKTLATLMILAVSAISMPTLVQGLHTSAAGHEEGLSIAVAVILLIVFVASVPNLLGSNSASTKQQGQEESKEGAWPAWFAIVALIAAGVGSAFVSDWFVASLSPAINALHISQAFTGLIVVALAGNAVENVVGVQFALRNKADFSISVILNSSLQVALFLIPVLVLLSLIIGGTTLTLVFPPLLVAALALTALLNAFIIYDGESTWLEGIALMGLYGVIAISFWWG
jgi:Ca2+:H+ antiporter